MLLSFSLFIFLLHFLELFLIRKSGACCREEMVHCLDSSVGGPCLGLDCVLRSFNIQSSFFNVHSLSIGDTTVPSVVDDSLLTLVSVLYGLLDLILADLLCEVNSGP